MTLVSTYEEDNYKECIYEYGEYIIEETYYCEDDCRHHQARVLLNGTELAEFNWNGCLQEAMDFIDGREAC